MKLTSPLPTLKRRQRGSRVDCEVKGIVLVKDWFKGDQMLGCYDDFFIVAQWHEYSDGQTISIEGGTTIAICRDLKTAKLVYSSLP